MRGVTPFYVACKSLLDLFNPIVCCLIAVARTIIPHNDVHVRVDLFSGLFNGVHTLREFMELLFPSLTSSNEFWWRGGRCGWCHFKNNLLTLTVFIAHMRIVIFLSITHGCTDIPGENLICVTFTFQTYVIFVFQIYSQYIYILILIRIAGHGTNCGIYPSRLSKITHHFR